MRIAYLIDVLILSAYQFYFLLCNRITVIFDHCSSVLQPMNKLRSIIIKIFDYHNDIGCSCEGRNTIIIYHNLKPVEFRLFTINNIICPYFTSPWMDGKWNWREREKNNKIETLFKLVWRKDKWAAVEDCVALPYFENPIQKFRFSTYA